MLLWVGDHIALPVGGDPTAHYPSHQPRLEALTALTYLAAVTSKVRLGVGVIVLPQRQPVLRIVGFRAAARYPTQGPTVPTPPAPSPTGFLGQVARWQG